MQVYFARSIRGGHNKSDQQVNDAIVQAIKAAGCIPALELEKPTGVFDNVASYIYQRDIEWINGSQAMIAEVSNPSLGVGYEIAYARHVVKIPILCVARIAGGKVSAMITGSTDVVYFLTLTELAERCIQFLGELKPIITD